MRTPTWQDGQEGAADVYTVAAAVTTVAGMAVADPHTVQQVIKVGAVMRMAARVATMTSVGAIGRKTLAKVAAKTAGPSAADTAAAPAQTTEAAKDAAEAETLAALTTLDTTQRVAQRIGCVTGAQLRRLRRQAGWTQRELAERLAYSQQEVSAWEAGRHRMPLSLARRLLDLLLEAKQVRDNYTSVLRGIEHWPTLGEW